MNRDYFKNFIRDTVAPNTISSEPDLHVDPYGNFTVIFYACSNSSFADSDRIRSYGKLGEMLIGSVPVSKSIQCGIDLHKYIKTINDVEMNVNAKILEMPGASYAIHRLMPMNSSNTITMQWLNTKTPFIETVFMPWMQDNSIYGHFPIVKADMVITFPMIANNPKNKIKYIYYGIRPVEVGMHKMTNEPLMEFYRKVTFDFDYFYAETDNITKISKIDDFSVSQSELAYQNIDASTPVLSTEGQAALADSKRIKKEIYAIKKK